MVQRISAKPDETKRERTKPGHVENLKNRKSLKTVQCKCPTIRMSKKQFFHSYIPTLRFYFICFFFNFLHYNNELMKSIPTFVALYKSMVRSHLDYILLPCLVALQTLKIIAKNSQICYKTIFRKINTEETFLPFTIITN